MPFPHALPDPQAAALLNRNPATRTKARRALGGVSFKELSELHPHAEERPQDASRSMAKRAAAMPEPGATLRDVRATPALLRMRAARYCFAAVPPRFHPRPPSPKISKPVSVTAIVSSSLMKPREGCFSVVSD